MKIAQLLSGVGLYLTNEERQFVKKYDHVPLSSLDNHNTWIAQNLVRKGAYAISNDNNTLVKKLHETGN